MLQTGDLYRAMWSLTINKYPHLAVIDDDNYVHAVLDCRTVEAQNDVLRRFLESRKEKLPPTNDVDAEVVAFLMKAKATQSE